MSSIGKSKFYEKNPIILDLEEGGATGICPSRGKCLLVDVSRFVMLE
jgi:hypothetical protein